MNIGGSSSLSCTASNVGDRELVITSIDIAGANFTRAHDCSNVAPGNSCGITVTFTPTAAGPKAAKLTITSSDPYSPRDVPFNGTGVSTLTVAVHPPGGGTVTGTNINCPGDCVETYSTSGATVQLTATPLGAYQFVNWTGTASGVSNPITLNMDVNQSITANFEASTYVLTVNKAGPGKGTVTSLDGKISCGESCSSQSAEYNAGDSVTLSANAGSGSAFSSWSGGGCTGVGTCLLTMNADVTVTASFDVVIAPKMLVSSIILSEDFSTGIPTSWPVGGDFTTGGPGIPCPATPAIAAPFAAPWAIVDSSCFETLYEELYTPIFDASSCSNVSLLFSNQYYDDPSSSVHVAITDNDGLPW
ncbi:MAG: choice-of-anchor D domain-containing protein, partial [Deltaproteobacteria bacterium]|nr:choice-of-anchor D domain-containing protein [Deltaproteobacteria bacterium]